MTLQTTNSAGGYAEIGAEIGALVESKQRAYGDAFGRCSAILRVLYPGGIPPESYGDALAVVRVLDKLSRLAQSGGDSDPMGESPWQDIAGYAILSLAARG